MTTQQLFYENAVPISHQRHGGWSVEVGADFGFSRHVNSLPVMAVEFPFASTEYAIVFAGSDQAVMPAAIVGVRNNENLFVDDAGAWTARYVPAFARRYPFIFASSQDGQTFTLCIDEAFPGVNQAGRGAALFDPEGKPTEYVQNVLKFLQEYQAQFQRTQQFCKKLRDHNLLEPMQAQITTAKGEKMSLSGFMTISRDRLKTLTGEALADLAKTDELELIYLHLHSMRNFQSMIERLEKAPVVSVDTSVKDPLPAGTGTVN
ncbi:MAG: SapC family protein [Burkholderiales bacterium]